MFHHPYNWLNPKNGRAFRRNVEGVANIILTGHEHDADWQIRQGPTGQRNLYIEGGVLQAHDDPDHSTFNAVCVDSDQSKQKVVSFSWDGSRYTPEEGAWEDLQVNRLHGMRQFELTSEFEQSLADPGIPHGRSDIVQDLEDFFVYPELKLIPVKGEVASVLADGNQIRDAVLKERCLAILGEEQAGKTALGKMLFRDILNSEYIPVLLTGRGRRPPLGERLQRLLEETFSEQYTTPDRVAYQQLDRERKVIIVDDLHRFQFGRAGPRRFLSSLEEEAAHVLLLADEFQMQLTGVVDSLLVEADAVPYPVYRIQPLRHVKQAELITRWLLLTEEDTHTNRLEMVNRFSEMKALLDGVLERGLIPTHPVILLSLLRAIPSSVDAAAASKGYFHELLILEAITYNRSDQGIDFLLSYLSHLAYHIYEGGLEPLDDGSFRAFHRGYEEKYAIERERGRTVSELRKIRILSSAAGVDFKYRFVLYYFVARYMRDILAEGRLRVEVSELTLRLHEKAAAGILPFPHSSEQTADCN